MSDSEIFENYASSMKDQGLIAEADYADARVGSDDISTIEALYGLKPNEEDKKHIVDRAHPDVAVVSPAYDRMNGVVENLNERHNMMAYIALKEPNGNLTQHRYVTAKKELVDELVRVGFTLDSSDEHVLMSLADSCSERLTKEAIAPFAVGAVAFLTGFSGATGVSALVNFAKPSDQGILNNLQATFEEIEEARESLPRLGKEIDFLENRVLRPFEKYVMDFENQEPVNADVANPSLEDVKAVAQDPEKAEKEKAVGGYIAACKAMIKILPRYISLFNAAAKEPKRERSSRWWAHVQEFVGEYIVPPEAKDVALHLQTLKDSCAKSIQNMRAIHGVVKQRTMDLATAMKSETAEIPPAPTQEPVTTTPSLIDTIEKGQGEAAARSIANAAEKINSLKTL